jgi:hypothetical protein
MQTDDWIRLLAFIIALGLYTYRWHSKQYLVDELDRNEKHEPPSDQQIRWHLTHMREDLYMIATSVHVLTLLTIAYVVWHW